MSSYFVTSTTLGLTRRLRSELEEDTRRTEDSPRAVTVPARRGPVAALSTAQEQQLLEHRCVASALCKGAVPCWSDLLFPARGGDRTEASKHLPRVVRCPRRRLTAAGDGAGLCHGPAQGDGWVPSARWARTHAWCRHTRVHAGTTYTSTRETASKCFLPQLKLGLEHSGGQQPLPQTHPVNDTDELLPPWGCRGSLFSPPPKTLWLSIGAAVLIGTKIYL